MHVVLSQQQLSECEEAARLRTNDSRRRGYRNKRNYQSFDDIQIQAGSFAAELAVAQFLGCSSPPQTGIGQVGKPDIVFEGHKIDVKSSQKATHLNVAPDDLKDDWTYALVKVNCARCEIIGFAKGIDVRLNGRLTNFGHTDRPAIFSLHAELLSPDLEDNCPF